MNTNVKKLAVTAMFAALAVVGSMFSFPFLGSKCAPVQHLVNILSGIILGPWWAVLGAFVASVIRNITGLGSPFAFPGSMVGAFLAGFLYQKIKKLPAAYVGELFGTSVIGGMLCFPIAKLVMHNDAATLFAFVFPFFASSLGGTIIAIIITLALKKTGVLSKMISEINS